MRVRGDLELLGECLVLVLEIGHHLFGLFEFVCVILHLALQITELLFLVIDEGLRCPASV